MHERHPFLRIPPSREHIKEGTYTRVYEVQGGPTGDSVLKEYKPDEFDSLFDEGPVSIHEQARELQKREQTVSELYSQLPQLVVPTDFFIAKNAEQVETIYAFQTRLRDFIPLFDETYADSWEDGSYAMGKVFGEIRKLPIPEQRRLLDELRYFLERTIEIRSGINLPPDYLEYAWQVRVPDFTHGNLVITREGDLRMIDTNYFNDLNASDEAVEEFWDVIPVFEKLIHELETELGTEK